MTDHPLQQVMKTLLEVQALLAAKDKRIAELEAELKAAHEAWRIAAEQKP